MNDAQGTSRADVPERVKRLLRFSERLEMANLQLNELQNTIALDIIDGWSTGNPVLDFALVACDGPFHEPTFTEQYTYLDTLPLRNPRPRILIIQEGGQWHHGEMVLVRNVIMATVRCEGVEWNTNTLTIGIPVESHYLVSRRVVRARSVHTLSASINSDRLCVGPPHSLMYQHTTIQEDERGLIGVSAQSTGHFYIHPWDPLELYEQHGMDVEYQRNLFQTWIRLKNK